MAKNNKKELTEEKKINILKSKFEKPIPEEKFKFLPKFLKVYLPLLLGLSLIIIGGIITYLSQNSEFSASMKMIFVTLYLIFTSPLIILFSVLLFYNTIIDIGKAKGFIIGKISKNALIARYHLPQKRVYDRIVNMEKNGTSFFYDQGEYIIDHECMFRDEKGNTVSHYLYGMPNPLNFDFATMIQKYYDNITPEGEISPLLDKNSNEIMVLYNSKNLTKYMNDKLVEEFHRPEPNKDSSKMLLMMVILIVILIIGFVLMWIFGRKGA